MSQIERNKVDIITVIRNNRLNDRSHIILGSVLAFIVITVSILLVLVWQPGQERTTCRFVDNDAREKLMYVEDGPCPDYAYIETWIQTGTVSTPFERQEQFWKEKQRQAAADRAKAIANHHQMVVEQESLISSEEYKSWLKQCGQSGKCIITTPPK